MHAVCLKNSMETLQLLVIIHVLLAALLSHTVTAFNRAGADLGSLQVFSH